MTGFCASQRTINGQCGFTLSLKSVNHRFLDLHFRMPVDSDGLEMKLRRELKEKLARGHVELTLNLERRRPRRLGVEPRAGERLICKPFALQLRNLSVAAEPDLNIILRLPGAMDSAALPGGEELESSVLLH